MLNFQKMGYLVFFSHKIFIIRTSTTRCRYQCTSLYKFLFSTKNATRKSVKFVLLITKLIKIFCDAWAPAPTIRWCQGLSWSYSNSVILLTNQVTSHYRSWVLNLKMSVCSSKRVLPNFTRFFIVVNSASWFYQEIETLVMSCDN